MYAGIGDAIGHHFWYDCASCVLLCLRAIPNYNAFLLLHIASSIVVKNTQKFLTVVVAIKYEEYCDAKAEEHARLIGDTAFFRKKSKAEKVNG